MIKRLGVVLLAMLVGVAVLLPGAEAQTNRFFLQAVGDNGEEITSGRCIVLTAGTNTLPTIYDSSSLSTSKTNPVSLDATLGTCDWYLATGTTAVDVILTVDGGPYKGTRIRVDNVTRTGARRVVVNRSSGAKVLAVPFTATGSTSQQATTYTIPAGAAIRDVVVQTTTAVAASTLNVSTNDPSIGGTGGTQNGIRLCNVVTTAAAGFAHCAPTALMQTTSNAVTYHNQNHASAGFIWVYYFESGNEP